MWKFNDASGKLELVQDTNGNSIALGYDTYSRLTSLTHSDGRQFLLEYAPANFGMDPSKTRW